MRSEKGITLVALIGTFVLVVILAGISIAIVAKGNNEVQEPNNDIVTNIDEYEDEYEEEIIIDNTAKTSVNEVANNVTEDADMVVNEVEE